jgi:hypothetical protein
MMVLPLVWPNGMTLQALLSIDAIPMGDADAFV